MIYLLILIQVILVFLLVFSITQFYRVLFRGFAPFVSTKFKTILNLLKEVDLKEDDFVYELGSGKAGFLRAVEQKFNLKNLYGVEYAFLPYFLARIQIAFSNSRIKLIRKNIFKVNLEKADLIYCFLSPDMMMMLKKKFEKECKKGCVVVSYKFEIPEMEAEKVIKEDKDNIYFYRF